jgi:hypothetical protein
MIDTAIVVLLAIAAFILGAGVSWKDRVYQAISNIK